MKQSRVERPFPGNNQDLEALRNEAVTFHNVDSFSGVDFDHLTLDQSFDRGNAFKMQESKAGEKKSSGYSLGTIQSQNITYDSNFDSEYKTNLSESARVNFQQILSLKLSLNFAVIAPDNFIVPLKPGHTPW